MSIAPSKIHLSEDGELARCTRRILEGNWTKRAGEVTCNACRQRIGAKRLPSNVRLTTPLSCTEPEPAVGQTWEDVQARNEGRPRVLTIVKVDSSYVHFTTTSEPLRGVPRRALRERFRGGARGYRHVGGKG
jgi:hypothetical protein